MLDWELPQVTQGWVSSNPKAPLQLKAPQAPSVAQPPQACHAMYPVSSKDVFDSNTV